MARIGSCATSGVAAGNSRIASGTSGRTPAIDSARCSVRNAGDPSESPPIARSFVNFGTVTSVKTLPPVPFPPTAARRIWYRPGGTSTRDPRRVHPAGGAPFAWKVLRDRCRVYTLPFESTATSVKSMLPARAASAASSSIPTAMVAPGLAASGAGTAAILIVKPRDWIGASTSASIADGAAFACGALRGEM